MQVLRIVEHLANGWVFGGYTLCSLEGRAEYPRLHLLRSRNEQLAALTHLCHFLL
jgi:hypothetical protein